MLKTSIKNYLNFTLVYLQLPNIVSYKKKTKRVYAKNIPMCAEILSKWFKMFTL